MQAENEDFKYPQTDGIWYTIIDAEQHLVRTKEGFVNNDQVPLKDFEIIYGNNVEGELIIPEYVENDGQSYTVVEIGKYGFSNDLTSVKLPSTIKTINESSFYKTGLTSIDIPESVRTIGAHAFQECRNLSSVRLPEGLLSIGAFSFYNCSELDSIELPSSLDAIGASAFTGCTNLKSITCPNIYPPAITINSFPVSQAINIFVPKPAITAYTNSSVWKKIGNIQPIKVPAEGVSIDRKAMIVYVNGTNMPLRATAYPESTTDTISWSVSPSEIAQLKNGLVKGLSEGEAIVTATCGNHTDSCVVTVKNIYVPDYVAISLPSTHIYVGDDYTFTATGYPQYTNEDIIWSVSNENIATIDSSTGTLTGIAPGELVVYAQCGNKKGAREISIYAVPANSITIDKFEIQLQTTQTHQITADIFPENTTDKTLVWKSSNESVAIVNNGLVTALKEGEATITVSCAPFAYNTCHVIVEPTPASEVILSDTSVSLKTSQEKQLSYTILPETTTDKTVTWTSLNPEIAEVSSDGVISAKASGVAYITATCANVSSECVVNVEEVVPEEIIINISQLSLRQSENAQLSANRQVTWKSQNESIATVSSDGLVTATGIGQTTISAADGALISVCDVTVEEMPAEEVILNEGKLVINVTTSCEIKASVLPLTTSDSSIVWQTDAPEIATVEDGVITGIAPGNAIITAICGKASAVCNVTVLSPAQNISLNTLNLSMHVGEIEGLFAKIDPFDSTDTIVEWVSSDPLVAEVNSSGVVQAISVGDAVITASCGNNKAECSLNVIDSDIITGIHKISPDADGLYVVYSTNGILMMKTSDLQKLHTLSPGIYIINGKKTLIN